MLSWLVDHTWTIYLILIVAGLVALAAWWRTRQRSAVIGLAVVAGAAALVFLLSLVIDTDRKQIARTLDAIARGMREKPPTSLFEHVSDSFQSTFMVKGGSQKWTKTDLRRVLNVVSKEWRIDRVDITELKLQSLIESEATVTFRALPVGDFTALACPCEAQLVRDKDGKWRMIGLKIFNPFVNATELVDLPIGD
jgi:hypothetical protein